MKKINIEIHKDFMQFKQGQIIELDTDNNETPLSKFWRDRLKDSHIDGCVSIVKQTKKSSKKFKQEINDDTAI